VSWAELIQKIAKRQLSVIMLVKINDFLQWNNRKLPMEDCALLGRASSQMTVNSLTQLHN
jgi:hypothetical protein